MPRGDAAAPTRWSRICPRSYCPRRSRSAASPSCNWRVAASYSRGRPVWRRGRRSTMAPPSSSTSSATRASCRAPHAIPVGDASETRKLFRLHLPSMRRRGRACRSSSPANDGRLRHGQNMGTKHSLLTADRHGIRGLIEKRNLC
jgi:hypothetical protein